MRLRLEELLLLGAIALLLFSPWLLLQGQQEWYDCYFEYCSHTFITNLTFLMVVRWKMRRLPEASYEILTTTVADVRDFLHADLAIIYRFYPDWSSVVIVESVAPTWVSMLGREMTDPCLLLKPCIAAYTKSRIQAIADIDAASLFLIPCSTSSGQVIHPSTALVIAND